MDMLLATGEQQTIALTAIALHALDVPAVSLTGAQAGIVTDGVHTKAKIRNITPQQVQEVVTAFDELLRWKESPNPTMSPEMQAFIERNSLHRLSEAMRPLEQVARACG